MTPNLLLKLFSYLVIFFVGFFLSTRCTQDKGGVQGESPTIKTEIKYITDTLEKEVVRTIYIDKPSLRTVYKDRIIPLIQPDSTPTLAVRDYQDSVEVVKNVKIGYTATTTGTLDKIQLGFRDTRPEIRTTLQITNEIKRKIPVTGLYVGGFSSPNLSAFGPEATIVMPRLSIGAGFNFKSSETEPLNRVQLHLGYNLFPTK